MTTETTCRVRDGVGFLEPTAKEGEPLQSRGVHTLGLAKGSTMSLSKGSLKRMQGAHLRGQVQEETPTRHRGGGFLVSPLSRRHPRASLPSALTG